MPPRDSLDNSLHIRPATLNDRDAIERLLRQADALHCSLRPDLFQPVAGPSRPSELMAGIIESPDSDYLLVEHSGAVIGVAEVSVMPPASGPMFQRIRKASLTNLVVDEAWRGRGVGQRLLAAVKQWAAERDVDRVEVTVYSSNEAAVEFYAKAGFVAQLQRLELRLRQATSKA
jgi:ribosomal protein S18 acetylase RimI-like enzyme